MLEALILVVFPFCLLYAAVSDMLSMTIENRVSLLLIGAFAAIAPLTGMEWGTYGWHFAAGFVVLLGGFGLFAMGGMGGGDAKLLAATALWMGFGPSLMQYVLTASILGGALTLAILAYRKSPLSVYTGHFALLRNLADRDVGVPYGVALAAAGLTVFPASPLGAWAIDRLAAG